MFSKCWLVFLSALSAISGCLPFTITTCCLTSLTKGSSKQVRKMRVFWAFFVFQLLFPISLPLLHFLTLYPPSFLPPSLLSSLFLFLFPSLSSLDSLELMTFSCYIAQESAEYVAGILIPNDFKYFLYFPLSCTCDHVLVTASSGWLMLCN